MKKLRKLVFFLLAGILLLVVIAVVAVGLFADGALKVAIETAGTKALSVGVSVKEVDLSILGGRLAIANLAINNPPGYQNERLLELGEARVAVDTKSLLGEIVNIKDIRLDGMSIVLEQRGVSGNNLQDIMKKLPAGEEKTSEPSGKKLHVDTLEITNANVKVKLLPVPGKADTLTLKLAPIKLTDLGGDNDLDTVGLSRTILLAVAGGIAEQGTDLLPKEMLGSITTELKKLGGLPDVLTQTGMKVLDVGADAGKGAGEGVIKGAEDVGKGITEGIKGLFEKKEE